jgi:DNA polymerase/3'-5' exonuclease PolX
MSNNAIADRLDAFAALLELAEANPFTARAYRRAAETVRGAPATRDAFATVASASRSCARPPMPSRW